MATVSTYPRSTEESAEATTTPFTAKSGALEIQDTIRSIQDQTRWSLISTVIVVLLLTATIVCLTLPALVRITQPFGSADIDLAVRGLVAMVLLFNVYAGWQHARLRKLCDDVRKSLKATPK